MAVVLADVDPSRGARRADAIASLTGIRGAAAIYVCLTHAQIVLAVYLQAPSIGRNVFFYNGFRGVDLFFILSGFILMHVHERDFRAWRGRPLIDFYVLRFFRVYPLNAAVLLLLVPIALALPGFVDWTRFAGGVPVRWHEHDFSASGFLQTILLAQTWSIIKPGQWNGPAWSLSAEVAGYAVFPVLAWAAIRCRSAALAASGAAASLVLLVVAMIAGGHATDNPTAAFGLVRMGFCFVAGVALSRCHRCWSGGGRWASLVTILSLIWIMTTLLWRPLNLLVVLGFGGIILGLAYRRGPVNAVLESRPALFLGKISFSFYLVHYIPTRLSLWLFDLWLHGSPLWLRAGCVVGLGAFCVGAATLLHRWVELPSQRLARRVLASTHGVSTRGAAPHPARGAAPWTANWPRSGP